MIRLQLALACLLTAFPARLEAISSRALKKLLADPPREFTSAPLWVWNDRLADDEVRGTLRELASQNVRQVFVHPRPGLMTPYLSPEWFRLWKLALAEAKRLDMNVWIYDENSYPSGFAGGWVPEEMPAARGLGLSLVEVKTAPKWSPDLLAVFAVEQEKIEDVSSRIKAGVALSESRYVVASLLKAPDAAWTGNRPYVNLLTRGVTEKFLDLTLGAYEREIGAEFGKRVPGIFTDEPNIRPAGGWPWCEDLPEEFAKRHGYSLRENLPGLLMEVGDWRRVRHDFYATLNDLFIERWAKPYYDRCDRLGLEFTGHYWDHEWPHCVGVPDNMAMAAWQHRPGIDTLMNQYAENTHAQFGNVRFCREISSLANQLGRRRTLVELYGAGGWDLRFEDMKRIGDWLQVLGLNTMDEHLSYITLRGARKRDHPQSFSYHEPWWEAYHVQARYLARLSCALSQGEQVNRVLVLEPTTTAWMYQNHETKLREIGDAFFNLLLALESAQIEYDLACEDVMAREALIDGQGLRIGHRLYERVVLPPGTENLRGSTWTLLHNFLAVAPTNLFACQAPARKDGVLQTPGDQDAAWGSQLPLYPPDALLASLRAAPVNDPFQIIRPADDPGILFHHRRHIEDGQILFLVNTSITSPSSGLLKSDLRGIESWDPYTGRTEPYPFERSRQGVKASFCLPPSGSLLLFLSKRALRPPPPRPSSSETTLTLPGETTVTRIEPNVLTLDYVDISAGGETRSNLYFYAANRFAWQQHGLDRNPWDNAVQFRDELLTRTFPPESGFTAAYQFAIEGAVPRDLEIVIERPDLYSITCNGQPLQPSPGSWWLDRAFGCIPLAATARPGMNVVTLTARPFTLRHELEPAYLRGDFALRPTDKGFVVGPSKPLRLAEAGSSPWNEQGLPFYSAGVAYRQSFNAGKTSGRYFLGLRQWRGSVAEVKVNGRRAGYISAPPWECEITQALRRGTNALEVLVLGTLKNTLGPHHGSPPLGTAWPGMFQNGPNPGPPPGSQYSTVGYGLFEPFVVRHDR